MLTDNKQFKKRFDTLRAETYRIIERAHSPDIRKLPQDERRKQKQESIAKLEDKLAAYINMLNALDREMEIKRWRRMVEEIEEVEATESSASQ